MHAARINGYLARRISGAHIGMQTRLAVIVDQYTRVRNPHVQRAIVPGERDCATKREFARSGIRLEVRGAPRPVETTAYAIGPLDGTIGDGTGYIVRKGLLHTPAEGSTLDAAAHRNIFGLGLLVLTHQVHVRSVAVAGLTSAGAAGAFGRL